MLKLIERDPDALLLAISNRALIGTIITGWDGWRAHLYRLAVDPLYRRRGVGKALIEQAEARLAPLGAIRIDRRDGSRPQRARSVDLGFDRIRAAGLVVAIGEASSLCRRSQLGRARPPWPACSPARRSVDVPLVGWPGTVAGYVRPSMAHDPARNAAAGSDGVVELAHDRTPATGGIAVAAASRTGSRVPPQDSSISPRWHTVSARAVGSGAVPNVEHDHEMLRVVDFIQNPPIASQAGAVDTGELIGELLADAARRLSSGPVMNSAAATATSRGSCSASARRAGRVVPSAKKPTVTNPRERGPTRAPRRFRTPRRRC